jgi:hypothetical protein
MIVKIDFRMCLIVNSYSIFNEISMKSQTKNGKNAEGISSITGFLDIISLPTQIMKRKGI